MSELIPSSPEPAPTSPYAVRVDRELLRLLDGNASRQFERTPSIRELLASRSKFSANSDEWLAAVAKADHRDLMGRIARGAIPGLRGSPSIHEPAAAVRNPSIALPETGPAPSRRLGLVPVNDDLVVEPRSWLIEGLWSQQAVGFICGPPKAGKSWLALDLAISVALGIPFLGFNIPEKGVVVYLLGEDFRADAVERIDRLLAGHERTRSELGDRLLITETCPRLENPDEQAELSRAVRDERPALVIIDPLERFLDRGDANSTKDMRPVTNFARQALARDGKTAVCVVHHVDKKKGELRGTGDFRALSEVTVTLGEARDGRVKAKVETRRSRPPEPMAFKLQDLDRGRVAWTMETDVARTAVREMEARELLKKAEAVGVSSEQIRKALHMRTEDVQGLMERIGAKRDGPKKPWRLVG